MRNEETEAKKANYVARTWWYGSQTDNPPDDVDAVVNRDGVAPSQDVVHALVQSIAATGWNIVSDEEV